MSQFHASGVDPSGVGFQHGPQGSDLLVDSLCSGSCSSQPRAAAGPVDAMLKGVSFIQFRLLFFNSLASSTLNHLATEELRKTFQLRRGPEASASLVGAFRGCSTSEWGQKLQSPRCELRVIRTEGSAPSKESCSQCPLKAEPSLYTSIDEFV